MQQCYNMSEYTGCYITFTFKKTPQVWRSIQSILDTHKNKYFFLTNLENGPTLFGFALLFTILHPTGTKRAPHFVFIYFQNYNTKQFLILEKLSTSFGFALLFTMRQGQKCSCICSYLHNCDTKIYEKTCNGAIRMYLETVLVSTNFPVSRTLFCTCLLWDIQYREG